MSPDLHAEAYAALIGAVHKLMLERTPTVPRTDLVLVLLDIAGELSAVTPLAQQRRQLLAEHARRLYVDLARPLDRKAREVMDLVTAREICS